MKITLIIGSRPQLIKASALLKELDCKVINTGQHYKEMNDLYQDFKCINLKAKTIPKMMTRLEKHLKDTDLVLVIGDTNSTLAGALTAKKMGIKVGHIEAGCRNYSDIQEEINRVAVDHISDYLFCSTEHEVDNLLFEGIRNNVFLTGDLMADIVKGKWEPQGYVLATFHRPENVDDKVVLEKIVNDLRKFQNVVWPIHPRTKNNIKRFNIKTGGIFVRKPASLKEMIALECGAELIVTDSGGVQRDAYLLGVPVIVARDKNEWHLNEPGMLGKNVAKKIRRTIEGCWNN